MIELSKLFFFFSARYLLTKIESMFSVFLSSYRSTYIIGGELEKAVKTLTMLLCVHVAVRLFSNRQQMTSKCSKNKTVEHEAIVECFSDIHITF